MLVIVILAIVIVIVTTTTTTTTAMSLTSPEAAHSPFTAMNENAQRLFAGLDSFRNSSAQDLSPEETALCSLNDLLVDGLWGVVHDNCAGLVVNLGVYTSITDEVDDPLFTLVLG